MWDSFVSVDRLDILDTCAYLSSSRCVYMHVLPSLSVSLSYSRSLFRSSARRLLLFAALTTSGKGTIAFHIHSVCVCVHIRAVSLSFSVGLSVSLCERT